MLSAITGSTTPLGKCTHRSAASVNVIECAIVNVVTTLTRSERRGAEHERDEKEKVVEPRENVADSMPEIRGDECHAVRASKRIAIVRASGNRLSGRRGTGVRKIQSV